MAQGGKVYGYARVSTPKQSILRQIDNISRKFPDVIMFQETYTGTTTARPEFEKVLRILKPGDTLVCDEVSRFSRTADEGFALYEDLFSRGVHLVFLKDPLLDTDMYRTSTEDLIDPETVKTGNWTDEVTEPIIRGVNQAIRVVRRRQFLAAFQSAEDEVEHLHKRVSDGVRRAQANGKHVGRPQGATVETEKSRICKGLILKHARDFGGALTDADVMALCRNRTGGKLTRNTYYKYKAQLKAGTAVDG